MEVLHKLPKFKSKKLLNATDRAEDCAIYEIDDERVMVFTVDFFTPIVDDPFSFGEIAVANSLSDIYAMGAKPAIALNIVAYPVRKYRIDELNQILKGGAKKAKEAKCLIAGGHTIDDPEPKYGLSVIGFCNRQNLLRKESAKEGDRIVLTKKIGTGILTTALKNGYLKERELKEAIDSMKTLNNKSSSIATKLNLKCATDVTGYGIAGHLLEVCESSSLSATIEFTSIPFFKNVKEIAKKGFIPGGTKSNFSFVRDKIKVKGKFSEIELLLFCDAQTSGGLLLSVPEEKMDDLRKDFEKESLFYKEIGFFKKGKGEIFLKKSVL